MGRGVGWGVGWGGAWGGVWGGVRGGVGYDDVGSNSEQVPAALLPICTTYGRRIFDIAGFPVKMQTSSAPYAPAPA